MKAHRIVKLKRLTGHYFYPPAPSSKSKTATITTKTTIKKCLLVSCFQETLLLSFLELVFFFQCRVISNGNKRLYTKKIMHHPEYRGTSGNFSCAPAVNKTSLEETPRGDKENGQRPSGQKRVRFFFLFYSLINSCD